MSPNSTLTAAEAAAFTGPLEQAGLPAAVVQGCRTHFALLRRWNETHNLTRITDPEEAAIRHYLDCALPVLRGPVPGLASREGFADIGSGAGFPGLVAALAQPALGATLIEPSRKRASFLRVAAGELGLGNVRVSEPRAPKVGRRAIDRDTPAPLSFPWVLSRATFSRSVRDELWPYVAPGGVLWVWTTPVEQDTWRDLVRTWPDAQLTWHGYELAGVGSRVVAMISRQTRSGH